MYGIFCLLHVIKLFTDFYSYVGSSTWRHQCTNIQINQGMDSVGYCEAYSVCVLRHICWNRRESWVHTEYGSAAAVWLLIINDTVTRRHTLCLSAGVDTKVGKDAKIIVACSTGGTLKPTQNFPDGKQSRYVYVLLFALQAWQYSHCMLQLVLKYYGFNMS
jgi:hypothetical protein